MNTNSIMKWSDIAFFVGLLLVATVVVVFGLRQSAAPDKTRTVLCHGIIDNTANTARANPEVLALCAEVGVTP